MFALPLPVPGRGPWVVVGVSGTGRDDLGRPGALAFHGLFVEPRELRRSRLGPFALLGALRDDWGADTTGLERGSHYVAGLPRRQPDGDPDAARVLRAILGGRRVAVVAREPVTDLARSVWLSGDRALRRRHCGVATLAYGPDLGFALAAYPRPALAGPEGSFVRLDELAEATPMPMPVSAAGRGRRMWLFVGTGLAVAVMAATALVVLRSRRVGPAAEGSMPAPGTVAAVRPVVSSGDPKEERERMAEALADMASRFAGAGASGGGGDLAFVLRGLAEGLRYDGPWLSEAEQAHLRLDGRAAASRAMEWHGHMSHFAPGRSLPEGLDRMAPAEQSEALARVFDIDTDPALPAADRVFALADALAAPWPVRPLPPDLVREHPALADYARFLARLPRR
jgi:hypothetical protein